MTAMLEARPVFDELLARYGFRLAVEHVEHESFGSSYAEYVRRGMRVRLIWDGKESVLSVVVARVSEQRLIGDWADLESMISGRPVSVAEAEAPDRVTRLRERTEQFLASSAEKVAGSGRTGKTP